MPTTDEATPQASHAELRDEIYRLDAVVSAQQEALAHWRRTADRDYGELRRLRRRVAELEAAQSAEAASHFCVRCSVKLELACRLCGGDGRK